MNKYLDPRSDLVFKRIFGEHPHLLMSFLNAVLPIEHPILSLTYIPTEQIPTIPILKRTVVDVKCKDALGRVFIVEMQVEWTDSFKQRLLFSSSQALVKQLQPGEEYHLIQPVYGLGLINAAYDSSENWYHHYKLVEMNWQASFNTLEHLQLIFIELPKFKAITKEHKHLRMLWLKFLKEITDTTHQPPEDLMAVSEIAEAVKLSEVSAYSQAELNYYDDYWHAVRTEKTLFAGRYREGRTQGLAEGLAQGRAEGLAQGLEQGLEQGRKEMALRLLEAGVTPEVISHTTQLSLEELKTLTDSQPMHGLPHE